MWTECWRGSKRALGRAWEGSWAAVGPRRRRRVTPAGASSTGWPAGTAYAIVQLRGRVCAVSLAGLQSRRYARPAHVEGLLLGCPAATASHCEVATAAAGASHWYMDMQCTQVDRERAEARRWNRIGATTLGIQCCAAEICPVTDKHAPWTHAYTIYCTDVEPGRSVALCCGRRCSQGGAPGTLQPGWGCLFRPRHRCGLHSHSPEPTARVSPPPRPPLPVCRPQRDWAGAVSLSVRLQWVPRDVLQTTPLMRAACCTVMRMRACMRAPRSPRWQRWR